LRKVGVRESWNTSAVLRRAWSPKFYSWMSTLTKLAMFAVVDYSGLTAMTDGFDPPLPPLKESRDFIDLDAPSTTSSSY